MAYKLSKKKMGIRSLWQNPSFFDRLSIDKQNIDSCTKALNIVHNQLIGMKVSLQRDMWALQRKYNTECFKPLQDLRSSLLALITSGCNKPSGTEIVHRIRKTSAFPQASIEYKRLIKHCLLLLTAGPRLKEQRFTDNFWLEVLRNSQSNIQPLIQDSDVEILKYLIDIKCDSLKLNGKNCVDLNNEDVNGFQLVFRFRTDNPYFENRKLIKRYVIDIYPKTGPGVERTHLLLKETENLLKGEKDNLLKYDGPRLVTITGTKIIWKEGSKHQARKVTSGGGLGSMVEFFEFSWAEATSKQPISQAEYDFMIGTYFRDILVTNAYEIYRSSYVNPNPSVSYMASTKSCSATEVGTKLSTDVCSSRLTTSISTPTIRSSEEYEGQDLGGCSQGMHELKISPQGSSKTPDLDCTRPSFFSFLQRGHAPQINLVCKNLFNESLRQRAQNEESDFEMKGGSSGRKRGFSKSGVREFEDRYPLKRTGPQTEEVTVPPESYPPVSSSVHQPTTSAHRKSSRSCKLKNSTESGVTKPNNLKPPSSPIELNGLLNLFKKMYPGLFQTTLTALHPSCGVFADASGDEESGWVDLPLDALSMMVQAPNVKQIIRAEEISKRRASRIKKMKEAARNNNKHGAAVKAQNNRKDGTSKVRNSIKESSKKPKSKITPARKRKQSRIVKLARRRTNKKFVSAKEKFLKRRNRLRFKQQKIAVMKNQGQASTTTESKSDGQPISRDAKSWITVSVGASEGNSDDGDSDKQENKSESKTSIPGPKVSAAAIQSPTLKLAEKLTSKVRKSRSISTQKGRSLQKMTSQLWVDFIKKNSRQSRSESDVAASHFAAGGKSKQPAAVTKRCEPAKDGSKRALEVDDTDASCSKQTPRSPSPQITQHFINFPSQERQVFNNNVSNESFEKKKMPKPASLPLWFGTEESYAATSNSMHCHGSKANGVASPLAKRPRPTQSLYASVSSSRGLKRKLDSVDDEASPTGKVQLLDNVLILRNGDLNSKSAIMIRSKSHKRKAHAAQPQPGLLERLASTMARPFRAAKWFFTGEIKEVP